MSQNQNKQQQWHAHSAAAAAVTHNFMNTPAFGHMNTMFGGNCSGSYNIAETYNGSISRTADCSSYGTGGGYDLDMRNCEQSPAYSGYYPNHNQLTPSATPHMIASGAQNIKVEPPDHIQTPTIQMEELIIKSEPPDETYKYNSVNDYCTPYSNNTSSMPAMMSTPPLVHNIKQENSLEPTEIYAQQQRPLNFPRRKVQTERSDTLPICQRCKQAFLKKHCYVKHVAQSVCNILEYDFKCCICPMSFMSHEELQMHERLHAANKFFCHKYCGKHFDNVELCESHEYGQHEYPHFPCKICPASFQHREHFFAHLYQHKHQIRYDCCVCRLWFHTPYELHQHRSGAPYFCGRFYTYKEPMNYHRSLSLNNTPNMSQPMRSYSLQDCHMGVIEPPSSSNLAGYSSNNCAVRSNYASDNNFPSHNFIKTEFKAEKEDDYYTPTEYPSRDYKDCNNDAFNNTHINSLQTFSIDYLTDNKNCYKPSGDVNTQISKISNDEDDACCVPKCGVSKKTCPTLQFFPFPTDDHYLNQWLHNLKMPRDPNCDYTSNRICNLHFPKRCMNRYSLCYWAVPTFNLGHDDVATLYQNREITSAFTCMENAQCSMPGCTSQRGRSNLKFYNFPKDTKMLIKWCQNARLSVQGKELRHFCSLHFEDRCFGKFRLKPWAVPTLELGTSYGKIHDNPSVMYLEEKKCCLPHCRRTRSSQYNLSLYRFPRDERLLRRWCYNLRLDPSIYRGKNHKICSAHFIREALGLRKLSPGAVPTLNLGHNDSFDIYENELNTPPSPPPPPMRSQLLSMAQSVFKMKKYKFHASNASISSRTTSTTTSPTTPASTMVTNNMDFADVCFLSSCKCTRQSDNVTLHTIPRRPEQRKKWCHNLKLDPAMLHKGVRICSLHFEKECIGGCMRPFAVPTLNLGHDDPNIYKNPDVIKKLNIRETCCIPQCKRNRDRDHASLHRFPHNPELFEKWFANLRKPLPDGTKLFNDAICEIHFEDRCLRNKRLEKWAIPTINLGHTEEVLHQLPSEAEIAEFWTKQTSTLNTGDEVGECCVETCKRDPRVDDIRLYRWPEESELLAKWLHNIQCDLPGDASSLRICSLHFEAHCFKKLRLHHWALPTLNLAKNVEHLFRNPERALSVKKEKGVKEYKDKAKKWSLRCCLSHCRKMRSADNVQLFRFPHRNRGMLAKWCHNLQLPMTDTCKRRICSMHFEAHALTKRCPMQQSVPTLDLNTPPGYKIYQNPARLKIAKQRLERICAVPTCRKTRSDGVNLYRFPQNRRLLRKWCHNTLQKINEAVRAQYRVCSEHFEHHSFGARRLCPGSIPTLNLSPDVVEVYPNEAQKWDDKVCVVNGCNMMSSVVRASEVRFYKFPCDNEDQLWKWCNNLKMNPIDCHGVHICSRHFEAICLSSKLFLYKWAIPTLQLGHDDADIELVTNPSPEARFTSDVFAKCCVPTCGKSRKYDDAQMNSFPKNAKMFERWKHNLKLEYLNFREREKYKICNDHFEQVCLGKMRLNCGAIPTINLGHDDVGDLFKVNPKKLFYTLFGKNIPVARRDSDSDNDDTMSETSQRIASSEPIADDHAVVKCSYPNCTATKVMLRESVILPLDDKLLDLCSQQMCVEKAKLMANPRLCGLHYMCIYEITIARTDNVIDLETSVHSALTQSYRRCCNLVPLRSSKCCISGCVTTTQQTTHKLFEFPNDRVTFQKWLFNTSVELVVPERRRHIYKVCSLHFESNALTKAHRLRPWALPTLLLNHVKPDDIYRNSEGESVSDRECCVPNCLRRNKTDEEAVRLFDFPTDETLLTKWLDKMNLLRDRAGSYKICERHFTADCFENSQLCSWAIPTQYLEELADEEDMLPNVLQVKVKKSLDLIKCCVPACRKSRLKHGVRLFAFPNSQLMLKKWCHNLQLPISIAQDHPRICNMHFHKRCIEGKSLQPWAKPTKRLGHHKAIYDNPKSTSGIFLPSCCLSHCRKQRTLENNLRTFGFPRDAELFKKWCDNLKLPNPNEYEKARICIEHFDSDVTGNRKLKAGAVPTLNLGHDEIPLHNNVSLLSAVNNIQAIVANDNTPSPMTVESRDPLGFSDNDDRGDHHNDDENDDDDDDDRDENDDDDRDDDENDDDDRDEDENDDDDRDDENDDDDRDDDENDYDDRDDDENDGDERDDENDGDERDDDDRDVDGSGDDRDDVDHDNTDDDHDDADDHDDTDVDDTDDDRNDDSAYML